MTEITPADTGVWLDGTVGWHNNYRVVDLAEKYGYMVDREDARILDIYRDSWDITPDIAETVDELSQEATDYLQGLAPEGYVFVWDAGELSLQLDDQDAD